MKTYEISKRLMMLQDDLSKIQFEQERLRRQMEDVLRQANDIDSMIDDIMFEIRRLDDDLKEEE